MIWAHPRSRGENSRPRRRRGTGAGSSPLTRGKRRPERLRPGLDGLIPAHAGKTRAVVVLVAMIWAHPRSRGENWTRCAATRATAGSSPLTRGKPRPDSLGRVLPGLIPAHAGKTIWGSPTAGTYKGSSPLTRGKHRADWPRGRSAGLIPAHAGKTLCSWRLRARARAHPRSRGENESESDGDISASGSSPLTRGKHRQPRRKGRRCGLIPAHAGKTSVHRRCARQRWAHPRSRGENAQQPPSVLCGGGSSPLTRGKLRELHDRAQEVGLIPAHAGKTAWNLPAK